ncbi:MULTISPECIES: hypothetical protein [unclassified Sphingobacterium]|uniref:hypothetical protein n=1 Tax=unclassified Sphingobacterium TaxID=2609468 RepID=UPI001043FF23|nr:MULTISPECIES: hypothetical protein [unclassified Sphingobacterium]MCS3555824.1 hypothetical protein [Sphingobacterium sp. JUb21]TCR00723.1 glycosyltransferase involved in cell wall biosynthesis [Sphingobacterium sp. JUb20]
MRIVYITEVNLDKPSGVLNKLNQQVESWTMKGNDVYVVSIPSEVNFSGDKLLLTSVAKDVFIYKNKKASSFFSKGELNFINKFLSTSSVKNYIATIKPDVIYMREMVAFPRITAMFSKYPVVLESNTLLEKELKFCGFALRLFYNLFQPYLNKRIDGFIGVTDEISTTYIKYNKPTVTIGNSIHIDIDIINQKKTLNSSINIIFVGSPDCTWHGIDKFVKMASHYPQYSFYLVGPIVSDVSLPNLKQMGFLGKDELADLYSIADIGVGSLALHRNEMNQACPLKVREYLSLGLPIIIAYEDKDLNNQDFVLQLPNEENCIDGHLGDIEGFIEKWKGQRINLDLVHSLVSTEVKEDERLIFLSKVIGDHYVSNRL